MLCHAAAVRLGVISPIVSAFAREVSRPIPVTPSLGSNACGMQGKALAIVASERGQKPPSSCYFTESTTMCRRLLASDSPWASSWCLTSDTICRFVQ